MHLQFVFSTYCLPPMHFFISPHSWLLISAVPVRSFFFRPPFFSSTPDICSLPIIFLISIRWLLLISRSMIALPARFLTASFSIIGDSFSMIIAFFGTLITWFFVPIISFFLIIIYIFLPISYFYQFVIFSFLLLLFFCHHYFYY